MSNPNHPEDNPSAPPPVSDDGNHPQILSQLNHSPWDALPPLSDSSPYLPGSRNEEEKESETVSNVMIMTNDEAEEKLRLTKESDYELLMDYLKKRLDNQRLSTNCIRDVEDICSLTPAKLFEKYNLDKEEDWYLFSTMNKQDESSSSSPFPADLKCDDADGFWRLTNLTLIDNPHSNSSGTANIIVGCKKTHQFYDIYTTHDNSIFKTNWCIDEYTLFEDFSKKLDNITLCKIYVNDVRKKPENAEEKDQLPPVDLEPFDLDVALALQLLDPNVALAESKVEQLNVALAASKVVQLFDPNVALAASEDVQLFDPNVALAASKVIQLFNLNVAPADADDHQPVASPSLEDGLDQKPDDLDNHVQSDPDQAPDD